MGKAWTLLFLCFLSTSLQGEVAVRLIDQIAVDHTPILLGDIATVSGDDSQEVKKVRQLPIATLPTVHRQRTLSAYRIRNLIEKQGVKEVTIFGLQSTVSVDTRQVSEGELTQLVKSWIQEKVGNHIEVEMHVLSLPKNWAIPKSDKVTLAVESRQSRPAGTVALSLKALSQGEVLSSQQGRVEVRLYQPAIVLNRPLSKGSPLREGDFEKKRADVTHATGMEIISPQKFLGMIAKKNLSTGALLSVQDFDLPTLISRGSLAHITVANGNIMMGITGAEALQSGKKGDRILFKNPLNPNAPIRAEVVKEGLATIRVH